MTAAIPSMVSDATTAQIITDFLLNTQDFVEEFTGCADTGADPAFDSEATLSEDFATAPYEVIPEVEDEAGLGTITRWFCLHVNEGHGWLSLIDSQGLSYVRGFYKSTKGDNKTADQVPALTEDEQVILKALAERIARGDSGDGTKSWISGIENPKGGGYITELDRKKPSYRLCWQITVKEWNMIAKAINADLQSKPGYNYFDHNCLGWAIKIAKLLGKIIPAHTTMSTPDPGVFTATLKKMEEEGKKPEGADFVDKHTPPQQD